MIASILLKLSPIGRFLSPVAALWRWFAANPWRMTLIVIAALLWRLWAVDADRDGWRAKAEAIEAAQRELDGRTAAAAATGIAVAGQVKGQVDAQNERAKSAAVRSDDPLAATLDSLRAEGAGQGRPAAK